MKARFEASLMQYVVRIIGWFVLTIVTLGIGGIWVAYDQFKWPVENSSLGDRKVTFTATFASFLGRLLVWVLVSIVTLGFGAVWVAYDATKWMVESIEVDGQRFTFNGTFTEFIGKVVIWLVVTIITLGLGGIWVNYDALKWTVERSTFAQGGAVHFTHTFTGYIGKVVIWALVTIFTLGIGGIWAGYDYYRWLADGITVSEQPALAPVLPYAA